MKFITPFPSDLTTRVITKFFGGQRLCTMKSRLRHNQGVVLFYNNEDKAVTLRHNNPIGIVDLRSIGYFRVSYQRLIAMAEQNFTLHHYKKMTPKSTPKSEESYMRMRYVNERVSGPRKKVRFRDPYPWLPADDKHRYQTDSEILYEKIDLFQSKLTSKEKSRLMKMVLRYKDAFSLRDELGHCPNLKADIQVIDDSPFFVRPFPIGEEDKGFMDSQMERLVSLGVLSKNSTSHTSPVMLITRKLTRLREHCGHSS